MGFMNQVGETTLPEWVFGVFPLSISEPWNSQPRNKQARLDLAEDIP
jgi:hypothetical protein